MGPQRRRHTFCGRSAARASRSGCECCSSPPPARGLLGATRACRARPPAAPRRPVHRARPRRANHFTPSSTLPSHPQHTHPSTTMAILATRASAVARPLAARRVQGVTPKRVVCRAEPEKGTIHFGGQEYTPEQWEAAKVRAPADGHSRPPPGGRAARSPCPACGAAVLGHRQPACIHPARARPRLPAPAARCLGPHVPCGPHTPRRLSVPIPPSPRPLPHPTSPTNPPGVRQPSRRRARGRARDRRRRPHQLRLMAFSGAAPEGECGWRAMREAGP
jgi:hypothetical protein